MSTETQTPFRIGGVYRDQQGRLMFRSAKDEDAAKSLGAILREKLMAQNKAVGASVTTADKFYDRMAEKLGLPAVASTDAWQKLGREIVPRAVPRTAWNGLVLYGLEATYVVRQPAKSAADCVGHALYKPAPGAEPKRAPLTWNKPVKVDRFPGFTSTYDGPVISDQGEGLGVQRISPIDRDPKNGSAFLKEMKG